MSEGPNVATDPRDLEVVDVDQLGRVHVVGLGGAGMSGIARILLDRGVAVSGSDAKESSRLANLRRLGAHAHLGHSAENLGEPERLVDTVMYSTAIPPTNPELVEARRLGLRVMERSAALASVMRGRRCVAVSGTHGKTTTTSMVTVALQHCSADPSFIIGSELSDTGSNGHFGSGVHFVVEADESDGCFLRLEPEVAIVTNVEPDHLNYWGTMEALEEGFDTFVCSVQERQGFAVVCIDDPGGRRLIERTRARGVDVRSYGTSPDADYRMEVVEPLPTGFRFRVSQRGVRLGEFRLAVPGEHNALNATAALVACLGLGYSSAQIKEGLAAFGGTRRRFEYRGEAAGVRVYDDYAHHPTEIAATLRAAQDFVGEGRVIAAFQAHHYYRTAMFLQEFGEALGLADEAVVLEIYAPGETPIPGASGQAMAAAVPLPRDNVVFEPSWAQVPLHLAARAKPGDIIMTLGAGDISLLGPEVLTLLRHREEQTQSGGGA